MHAAEVLAGASVVVSLVALAFSTALLTRQNKQLEHERNALAIIDAIGRLTDAVIVDAFAQLEDIATRYPDEESVKRSFDNSPDDHALTLVAQYVDAVGFMLRSRWNTVRPFLARLRRVRNNEFLFENFEWLAMYGTWWKDTPRPPGDRNYDPKQFAGLEFKV